MQISVYGSMEIYRSGVAMETVLENTYMLSLQNSLISPLNIKDIDKKIKYYDNVFIILNVKSEFILSLQHGSQIY